MSSIDKEKNYPDGRTDGRTDVIDACKQSNGFEPEKLIAGILYHDEICREEAVKRLQELYGDIDMITEPYLFTDISKYYCDEMGTPLKRLFVSFSACVDPSQLSQIKRQTVCIEKELSLDGKRQVNLDPGLVNRGRVLLATTKEAAHRIPLSDGIYCELTLFLARKQWQALLWTYLDFKTETVQSFLTEVHKKYLLQRKSEWFPPQPSKQ